MGKIVKAHGIKGAIQLSPYSDNNSILHTDQLFLRIKNRENTPFSVSYSRFKKKGGIIVKLEGVDSREEAERLKGVEVSVKKSSLPQPETGEFYYFQLLGLTVIDIHGNTLGTVKNVLDNSAQDLLVIKNSQGEESLIPLTAKIVTDIDLEGQICRVNLPPGLLEINF